MSYPLGRTLHAARTGSLRYGRTTLCLPAPPHAPRRLPASALCAFMTPPSVTRALFRLLRLAWSAPRTRFPSLRRLPHPLSPLRPPRLPSCPPRAGPTREGARSGSGRGGGTRTRSDGRRRPVSRCGCARASASTSSTCRPRPGTRRWSGSGGPGRSERPVCPERSVRPERPVCPVRPVRARRCRGFRLPSGRSGCCSSWRRVAPRSCRGCWSGSTGDRWRST